MVYNKSFQVNSNHRAVTFHDITQQVSQIAAESGISSRIAVGKVDTVTRMGQLVAGLGFDLDR